MASVLKRESVDFEGVSEFAAPRGTHASKAAQLVWLDGRPVAIEFVCSCGERSLIELEYDGAGAPISPRQNTTPAPKH